MLKKLFFYGLMFFFSLALTEIALQGVDFFLPNRIMSNIDPMIKDPILGHRPNPRNPDHDKHGFRNDSVPKPVDIVALGDSQTYGTGVPREEAWPQQLAKMTGLKVYNMAFGGYCPVHSLLLLDEAMRLKPKIVIEAFYAGNDLYEAFSIVYANNSQLNYLKTSDRDKLTEIEQYQQRQSIRKIVAKADVNVAEEGKKSLLASVKSFGYNHLKIYRVLSFTKKNVLGFSDEGEEQRWETYKSLANSKYLNRALPFEGQDIKTILTPAYRLSVQNFDDPRISEGLAICLKSLRMMQERLAAAGIDFYVLFIPTKELAFSEVAKSLTRLDYAQLISNEKEMWESTRRFLQQNNIRYIDALPYLQGQLKEGRQAYAINDDGHPKEYGHGAIAAAVAGLVKKSSSKRHGEVGQTGVVK